RSSWPISSTGGSRPKERSGTRSSTVCGRICDGRLRPLLAVGGQASTAVMENAPGERYDRAKGNDATARATALGLAPSQSFKTAEAPPQRIFSSTLDTDGLPCLLRD